MIYKYDFVNHKLYENDVELNATSVMLGRFEGSESAKESILSEHDDKAIYKLFLDNSGNYAMVTFSDTGFVSMITGGMISIYYYIEDGYMYFSELMKELENKVASTDQIDWDTVYYYVASGNYPPVERTFWKKILKVSSEHHAIIASDGCLENKKWTFFLPDKKELKKNEEYASIMDFEAEGIKNWLRRSGKKPYCLISGVDSFNSFLSLRKVDVNSTAIHSNVYGLQQCYVEEFIKEYPDTNYIEMNGIDFSQITLQKILNSYKESINPFLKMSTGNPITAMIFEKENGNGVGVTGELAGLFTVVKTYSSTLDQHSYWGRHFLGSIKRSYYSDRNLVKANNRCGKKNSLYDFMTSIYMPIKNYDAFAPFSSLKKAFGLNSDETILFRNIVHEYINSYASSVNWDVSEIYGGNVGKLFRSYLREFYIPAYPIYNEAKKHMYGDMEWLYLFSSIRASVFQDNYSVDFYNDIFWPKKCVFDYFDSHHPISMVTMAKKAFNVFKKRYKKTLKTRIASFLLYPVRFIPDGMKKNNVYQKSRQFFSFLKKGAGCNEYKVGAITVNAGETSDFICFSERCKDNVMKLYFEKLESAINVKDMMEYSPVEERYVALSVYMRERVRNSGRI
ncbi:hypothetical protein NZ47_03385 [Anaerovibrio lipolyticus]|uniref:Uncharacterized protein n=1 Tax=Anaerovibrio lipolyticus TaxID=82374 RepID=A0A0B2K1I1_9FIRM|nr:hypothetical protein [Anaerovibrio lipolyticus]KHM52656.1 hypothetical protein NZ47_03385 [Anaerovibrio lipolyticus]